VKRSPENVHRKKKDPMTLRCWKVRRKQIKEVKQEKQQFAG